MQWDSSFSSLVFSKFGECLLLINRGEDASRSDQSSPSSRSSSSLCSHGVTMETPLAHTLPLLLPKPRPHRPCASSSPRFGFSALMFVYFACTVCVLGVCLCVARSPSGSQSFFRARHMGALIRRFLPLERTVVALVETHRTAVKSLMLRFLDHINVTELAE